MSDMASPYKLWSGLKSHPLGVKALAIREAYGKPCRLSPLIAMSDPVRTPDILDWANKLPEHCALVYRLDELDEAALNKLHEMTQDKEQQLLIRQTKSDTRAQGLHFKRHTNLALIDEIKRQHPNILMSLAALKTEEYSRDLPALDALLVSSVFHSQSPSAGEPIGIDTLTKKAASYDVPVFALGGVNTTNADLLIDSGIAGIAAVGALS